MNDKEKKITDISNPALVYAMEVLKEKKDKNSEMKFISELSRARFISPAIIEVKDENGEYKLAETDGISDPENTRIHFMMLTQNTGKKFLPAFTDMDEVRKWRKEENLQTVVTTFDNHMEMILKDDDGPSGFVINPFGSNMIMPRELLAQLKEAADKHRDEKIMIGDPRDYPEDLVGVLSDFFEENGTVEKAYILMMKRGEQESYLLIIDFDNADYDLQRRKLFDAAAEAAKDHLNGLSLSIASFADELGKKAADNKLPFYTR